MIAISICVSVDEWSSKYTNCLGKQTLKNISTTIPRSPVYFIICDMLYACVSFLSNYMFISSNARHQVINSIALDSAKSNYTGLSHQIVSRIFIFPLILCICINNCQRREEISLNKSLQFSWQLYMR